MIVVLISVVFCAAAVGLTVAGFVKTSGDNPDGRILREEKDTFGADTCSL